MAELVNQPEDTTMIYDLGKVSEETKGTAGGNEGNGHLGV